MELLQIEAVFLKGCGYSGAIDRTCSKPSNPTNKDILFNGLCAVVTFLCKLDNIPDVLDYSKLFGYENTKHKRQLARAME